MYKYSKFFLLINLIVLVTPEILAKEYTPNPLSVDISLNSEKTVRKTISASGGSLSTTSGETTYTLNIPEGALIGPQTITMTPLADIQGLPTSGALSVGVKLRPEGLQFLKSAELAIMTSGDEGSNEEDNRKLVGYGFHKEGEEFYLRSADRQESSIKISLNHFSGYGASTGTDSEIREHQQNNPPTDVSDWFEQTILNNPGDQARRGAFEALYAKTLSHILVARSNSAFMAQAFKSYQSWYIQYNSASDALKTFFSTQNAELLSEMVLTFQLNLQEAKNKCRNHDLRQIGNFLRWSYLVLAHPLISQNFPNPQEVRQNAVNCAQFDLEVTSEIKDGENGEEYLMKATVAGTLDIEPDFVSIGGLKLTGRGALNYTSTDFNKFGNDSCDITVETQGDVATVSNLSLGLNLSTAGTDPSLPGGGIPVHNIAMSFMPGPNMSETVKMKCPYSPPFPIKNKFWPAAWFSIYSDQVNNDPGNGFGGGAIIRGWIPGSGRTVGTRTYNRSKTGFTEKTEYRLIHTPKL